MPRTKTRRRNSRAAIFPSGEMSIAPLSAGVLAQADVLVLVHPCDPRWERATSQNPPALSTEENAGCARVGAGGRGAARHTEYEHDK